MSVSSAGQSTRVSAEGSGGDKTGSPGSAEPRQQWREHSLQGPGSHTTVTSYQHLMTWPWRRGKPRADCEARPEDKGALCSLRGCP